MQQSLCCLLMLKFGAAIANVTAKIMDSDFVMGHDLTLYCNDTSNTTKMWLGGPTHELLAVNNISTHPEKYESDILDTGYYLIIRNSTKSDFNVSYTCSIGFHKQQPIMPIMYDDAEILTEKTYESSSNDISTSPRSTITDVHKASVREDDPNTNIIVIIIVVVSLAVFIIALVTGITYFKKRKQVARQQSADEEAVDKDDRRKTEDTALIDVPGENEPNGSNNAMKLTPDEGQDENIALIDVPGDNETNGSNNALIDVPGENEPNGSNNTMKLTPDEGQDENIALIDVTGVNETNGSNNAFIDVPGENETNGSNNDNGIGKIGEENEKIALIDVTGVNETNGSNNAFIDVPGENETNGSNNAMKLTPDKGQDKNTVDKVICFYCSGGLVEWQEYDDPWVEHAKYFPHCPFLFKEKGEEYILYVHRVHDHKSNFPVTRVSQIPQTEQEKSVNIPCAVHKEYELKEKRRKTLEKWRGKQYIDIDLVAEAGFFFQNEDDTVICFHCSGGAEDWQEYDDPWVEHAKYFPHCPYLLKEKGEAYILEVYRVHDHRSNISVKRVSQIPQTQHEKSVNITSAEHKEYELKEKRQKTLEKWPGKKHVDIDLVAEAGFFFQNKEVHSQL